MNTTIEVAWETRPDQAKVSQLAALILDPSGSEQPKSVSSQLQSDGYAVNPVTDQERKS